MMQTEFKAIAQSEYGAPEKVLKLVKRQFNSEKLGADEVLIKVIARPIHVGDVHILCALPQGGPVAPIPQGTYRVPGFEGVGTIIRLGTNAKALKRFSEGQRVAFFPANGSWAEYVVVSHKSLLAIPNKISNQIAAQMLINTITSSILIKTGHNSLKPPITPPVYILQNAATSGVGRLLTRIALDRGVRPIRLVRSVQSAERLRSTLPGPPIISTSDGPRGVLGLNPGKDEPASRSRAIGKNRFVKPSKDISSKSLTMPSAERLSTTLRTLSMRAPPSSTLAHWTATLARTFFRSLQIMSH
jgi:NADPH:quinone reductase-like Zn-dependent oxidoreductase